MIIIQLFTSNFSYVYLQMQMQNIYEIHPSVKNIKEQR